MTPDELKTVMRESLENGALWHNEVADRKGEMTDDRYATIQIFEALLADLDAVPADLLKQTAELATSAPEVFDEKLTLALGTLGPRGHPGTAEAFVLAITSAMLAEALGRPS